MSGIQYPAKAWARLNDRERDLLRLVDREVEAGTHQGDPVFERAAIWWAAANRRVAELEAAIRVWVRAHDDFQRGIAPAHLLHEAERALREVVR